MTQVPAKLRRLVLRRGAGLCEYCETAVDPNTGNEVLLFNPRRDDWSEHFAWEGVRLIGLTPVGRATISALDMNRTLIIAIREEEAALGRHPDR